MILGEFLPFFWRGGGRAGADSLSPESPTGDAGPQPFREPSPRRRACCGPSPCRLAGRGKAREIDFGTVKSLKAEPRAPWASAEH